MIRLGLLVGVFTIAVVSLVSAQQGLLCTMDEAIWLDKNSKTDRWETHLFDATQPTQNIVLQVRGDKVLLTRTSGDVGTVELQKVSSASFLEIRAGIAGLWTVVERGGMLFLIHQLAFAAPLGVALADVYRCKPS